ncbi:MAG: hypothetical protein JWP95_601 [Actinotalea sp.]|nr:hypothetical protein [Actinotalea sp.]
MSADGGAQDSVSLTSITVPWPRPVAIWMAATTTARVSLLMASGDRLGHDVARRRGVSPSTYRETFRRPPDERVS